jgi:paraquat-inducible protein B
MSKEKENNLHRETAGDKSQQASTAGTNARLIGAFMLGAIALIVVIFLVFGGGQMFKDKTKYVVYFRGSVDGLNTGAPVKIRGVQVGSVTDIRPLIHQNGDFLVEVTLETVGGTFSEVFDDGSTKKNAMTLKDMINRGLRAQLQSQSFIVSQKMIVVDYFPESEVHYAGYSTKYAEIPTIPAKSEELEQSLEKMVKEVGSIPFADISHSIQSSTHSLDTFFKTLKVQPLLDNINTNVSTIGLLATKMDTISTSVAKGMNTTTSAASVTLKNFDALIKRIEDLSLENQYLVKQSLEQLTSAARSTKGFMDYLQQHPSDIIYGK